VGVAVGVVEVAVGVAVGLSELPQPAAVSVALVARAVVKGQEAVVRVVGLATGYGGGLPPFTWPPNP
jgi:hypothetical protein